MSVGPMNGAEGGGEKQEHGVILGLNPPDGQAADWLRNALLGPRLHSPCPRCCPVTCPRPACKDASMGAKVSGCEGGGWRKEAKEELCFLWSKKRVRGPPEERRPPEPVVVLLTQLWLPHPSLLNWQEAMYLTHPGRVREVRAGWGSGAHPGSSQVFPGPGSQKDC